MQGAPCVASCPASVPQKRTPRSNGHRLGMCFMSMTLVVSSLALNGCSSLDSQTSSADVSSSLTTVQSISAMVPEEVSERQILRVSLSSTAPSSDESTATEVSSADTGSVVISPELDKALVKALATIMGLDTVVFTTVSPESSTDGLGSEADLVLGNLSVNSDFGEETYAITYIQTGSQFVTNSQQTDFSVQDPCGSTIGVIEESTQQNLVEDLSKRCELEDSESIQVQTFTDFAELSAGLADNQVDAVLIDAADQEKLQPPSSTDSDESDQVFVSVGDLQNLVDYVIVTGNDPQMAVALQAAIQYLLDINYIQFLLDKYGVAAIAPETSQIK